VTQSPKKPNLPAKRDRSNQAASSSNSQNRSTQQNVAADGQKNEDIVTAMVKKIDGFKIGLREYKIRELVEDTEKLGQHLKKGLKTTQIRKFLDAVKRFKGQQAASKEMFEANKDELHILRYQLAYAAARQQKNNDPGPVEPLKKVLDVAIKQVANLEDFNRLVQLIESIVAYHKAAGGKDQ
jgi:CRISPR-associated protein Csm2